MTVGTLVRAPGTCPARFISLKRPHVFHDLVCTIPDTHVQCPMVAHVDGK